MSIKRTAAVGKITAAIVSVATAISLVGAVIVPSIAAADAASDLQAKISAMLAEISSLQANLNAVQGTTGASYNFATNLKQGSTGADVMNLQKALNTSEDTMVASVGAGSSGNETSTFGPATKRAVIKFQQKYGIEPAVGFVGSITRQKLNSLFAVAPTTTTTTTPTTTTTTTTTTTVVPGTGLTVSSPVQPAPDLAVGGAARVPFTKVTLTAGSDGPVTVNSIVVERTGKASDTVFSGIVLLDETGAQLGIAKTLNSMHQATIGEAFTIPAGTSKTVTIAGNMGTLATLSGKAGEVPYLSVVSINTSATVAGTLPITGAGNTINGTLTIGSVTTAVSQYDPSGAQTKEIGTTNYKFAGVRVTAGSAEKVILKSIRWNQSGSASKDDLANVQVYVDDTAYPTTVSADGKYYTAVFGSGITVDKGLAKDIYVKGDIIGSGSATRTVQFDIYKNTDLYITGETYGYGITAAVGSGTSSTGSEFLAATPWYDASKITVSAGSVTTIAKATSVPAQNIAVNLSNQVLGGFETNMKGEAISVQTMTFTVASTSGSGAGLLTNVGLYDENGALVAGPIDATYTSASVQTLSFTDTVTFPIGKKVWTLKGKIASGIGNNTKYTVTITPSNWTNVTGATTGNTITVSNAAFDLNQMTVKAASLAITASTNPGSQTIVAGGSSRLFTNIQLDATQSGEDVKISTIPVTAVDVATAGSLAYLSSCQLFDGETSLNNSTVPTTATTTSFTFDSALTIPKGTVKTLGLKCLISSNAATASTYRWGITTAQIAALTATGVTSNNAVTATGSTANGGTMTVGAGTLVVTTDSASPSYTVVGAGSSNVTAGVIKFTTTNEAVNLKRVSLKLTNTASSTAADLVSVSLFDGSTKVGSATFTGTNTNATSTLDTDVVIPKNSSKSLTVKVDLPTISTENAASEGHLIAVDVNGSDAGGTYGTGAESGVSRTATGSTSFAGLRLMKSYPIITYSTTGATAQAGIQTLLTVNVAANSTGEVQLYKLSFAVATTTATVATPTFNGPNGSVGTVALNAAGTAITAVFDSTSNTADATIAAGQSKSYTLKGTVTLDGTNSTGSVSTALKADTAYPALAAGVTEPLMGTVTDVTASNIIWSPNSTTTSATTVIDWTNGYGLPGCFLTSGLGQNCESRVIAK